MSYPSYTEGHVLFHVSREWHKAMKMHMNSVSVEVCFKNSAHSTHTHTHTHTWAHSYHLRKMYAFQYSFAI